MPRHLLLLTLVLVLTACQQRPQPTPVAAAPATQPAPATAPAPKPATLVGQWRELLNGKNLDGWKVPEFGADGKVEVKNSELHIGMGEMCTGVAWAGPVPRDNFEIELEAKRAAGNDFFCGLTFPVGEKGQATLVLGGWGGSLVGISCIDGYDASDNGTTQTQEFQPNKWYHVRVRVTKPKIEAWLDDKQIINVDREGKRFDVRIEVEPCLPLGIATWRTHGVIRYLRLREVPESEIPKAEQP